MGRVNPKFKHLQNELRGSEGNSQIDISISNKEIATILSQQLIAQFNGKALFGAKDLQIILGKRRSTIYDMMSKANFPFQIVNGQKVIHAFALALWMVDTEHYSRNTAVNQ